MTKVILLMGALLLAGWYYYFQADSGRTTQAELPVRPARPAVPAPPAAAVAAAAPTPVAAASTAAAPPVTVAKSTTQGNNAAGRATEGTATPDTRPEWIRNPPDLGLTRTLTGDQAVSYDGRPRTVLGTKESQASGSVGQPVLLVRDENSGQIDYFQSGLQFRLKPGNDFAAFIAERTALRSQFSNADYANVMVEPDQIASEFKALQNDPRVSFVTFLKPRPSILPR